MTKPPEKTNAEGSPRIWWSLLLADHLDPLTSEAEIEAGIAGVALMPTAGLLVGAGPTRQDPSFDLQALLRTTPDLDRPFVAEVERYLSTGSDLVLARATRRAEQMSPSIRDRMRWHASHSGFRQFAAYLLAEVHLRGSAAQRAYVGALVQRVDRLGPEASWSTSCDYEILREGLKTIMPRSAVDHATTTDLYETLRDAGPTDPTWSEKARIGCTHRMSIPLSPRELAILDHMHINRRGMWSLLREGEYDHLSDDWRGEGMPAWQHGPTSDTAKAEIKTHRTLAELRDAQDDEPEKTEPEQSAGDTSSTTEPQASDPVAEALDLTPRLYVIGQPTDPELAKLVAPVSGRAIQLSVVPLDFDESYGRFMRCYPHATRIVERVMGRLRAGSAVGLERFLIVGAPGCGKSTFCIELASYLHLHSTVYPCASVADGSFGGTPAHWSSRRPSVPLQAIVRSRKANPLIVLDELEKTGLSDRNGSLVNSLLPMLEPHTASQYFETALELNADLSAVNFVATANKLDEIPAPILDRFTVLHMPSPGVEHTEALAQEVVRQLRDAHEERYEERPDLAPDELAVIRKAWGGGSLRKLNRAVDATLEAREAYLRSRPQ